MNTGMSFVAIVSLLLALAGADGTAKKQAQVNSPATRGIAPSKIVLNHNETMVSDATLVQQVDSWSQWLTSVPVFVFTRFSSYVPGGGVPGGCDEFGCGGNHNETFVQDAAPTQQADDWQLLTAGQQVAASAARLFIKFFIYVPGEGGCDEFGCGSNHNETMLSDTTVLQQADSWSHWLTSLQVFVSSRFSSYVPTGGRPGGCDEFGCGTNHNETMVSDATLIQQADPWSGG